MDERDWKARQVMGFGTLITSISGLVKRASSFILFTKCFLGQFDEKGKS
jgi:hypothetical protein